MGQGIEPLLPGPGALENLPLCLRVVESGGRPQPWSGDSPCQGWPTLALCRQELSPQGRPMSPPTFLPERTPEPVESPSSGRESCCEWRNHTLPLTLGPCCLWLSKGRAGISSENALHRLGRVQLLSSPPLTSARVRSNEIRNKPRTDAPGAAFALTRELSVS